MSANEMAMLAGRPSRLDCLRSKLAGATNNQAPAAVPVHSILSHHPHSSPPEQSSRGGEQLKAQPMPIQPNPATPAVTIVQSPLPDSKPFVIVPLVGRHGAGLSILVDQADWQRVSAVYGTRWGLYLRPDGRNGIRSTTGARSLVQLIVGHSPEQRVSFLRKRQVGSQMIGLDFRRSNLVLVGSRLQELGDIVVRRLAEGEAVIGYDSLRDEMAMRSWTSCASSKARTGPTSWAR